MKNIISFFFGLSRIVTVRVLLFFCILMVVSMFLGVIASQDVFNILSELFKTLLNVKIILAAIGVALFLDELKGQRELHKERLQFEQKMYEEKQKDRVKKQKALQLRSRELDETGEDLAKIIGEKLADNTKWAIEAFEKTRTKPLTKTLFGEREAHFKDEKEFLANNFVEHLLIRCKEKINEGKKVHLLFDSGTTIYSLFEKIGERIAAAKTQNEDWIKNLRIVTNNLPGVEALMANGRLNPIDRYAGLVVDCIVLPGTPIPVYEATLGEMTVSALQRIKSDATKSDFFIGIATGNWIRIQGTTVSHPISLARGDGHLEFKKVLVDCSDEVYVLANLAKIFIHTPLIEINQAWEFEENHPDPDKRPYGELLLSEEKEKVVKLVSTIRTSGEAVLYHHSQRLKTALGYLEDEQTNVFPRHILYEFDHSTHIKSVEERIEFPHRYTKDIEFRRKFFFTNNA